MYADSVFANKEYLKSKDLYRSYLDTINIYQSDLQKAKIIRNLAVCYDGVGIYDSAEILYQRSFSMFDSLDYLLGKTKTYSNLCGLYCSINKQSEAINLGIKGLELMDKFEMDPDNKDNIDNDFITIKGELFNSIGFAFLYQDDFVKALEYYKKALLLFEKTKNINHITVIYHNIGSMMIYERSKDFNNFDSALYYYNKELLLANIQEDKLSIIYANNAIAGVYMDIDYPKYNIDTGKVYLDKAYNILQSNYICDYKNPKCNADLYVYVGILISYNNYYFNKNEYAKAFKYAKKSLDVAVYLDETMKLLDSYLAMADINVVFDNYRDAYKYQKLYSDVIEEMKNEETSRMFSRREIERALNQNKILEAQNDAQQAKLREKNLMIYGGTGVSILIIVFLTIFIRYRNQQSKKLKQKKQLVDKANIKLAEKNKIIEQKNKNINDSITYAQRIQEAILPPQTYITELLHENFIFYKPKDIVSGDFYWVKQVGNHIITVVADCTGHGVPGAFMSMLGISFLNEIIQKREIIQTDQIINELRNQIKHSLRQHGHENETRDGMDIAVCAINMKNKKIQYSGAYNPLFLIREKNNIPELIEIKADRMPVGFYYGKEKPFTYNEMQLEPNDIFYTFSDGFIDQFGGDNNKRFMSSNFKKLLLNIYDEPMQQQKETLEKTFNNWKKDYEQMDDILIMGIKV